MSRQDSRSPIVNLEETVTIDDTIVLDETIELDGLIVTEEPTTLEDTIVIEDSILDVSDNSKDKGKKIEEDETTKDEIQRLEELMEAIDHHIQNLENLEPLDCSVKRPPLLFTRQSSPGQVIWVYCCCCFRSYGTRKIRIYKSAIRVIPGA